jgi:hypothetical protein
MIVLVEVAVPVPFKYTELSLSPKQELMVKTAIQASTALKIFLKFFIKLSVYLMIRLQIYNKVE